MLVGVGETRQEQAVEGNILDSGTIFAKGMKQEKAGTPDGKTLCG